MGARLLETVFKKTQYVLTKLLPQTTKKKTGKFIETRYSSFRLLVNLQKRSEIVILALMLTCLFPSSAA